MKNTWRGWGERGVPAKTDTKSVSLRGRELATHAAEGTDRRRGGGGMCGWVEGEFG